MTSPITDTTSVRFNRETSTKASGTTASSYRRLVRQGIDPVAASLMAGLT